MKRNLPGATEVTGSGRFRVSRWLAIVSGVIGSLFGIVSGLYSTEFRDALETSLRDLRPSPTLVFVVISSVVASASTTIFYRSLVKRRQQGEIVRGEIPIQSDALTELSNQQDSVVGRRLVYLEAKRHTGDLVVFLHGLGLDASDFRPYMLESKFHCVSLTMFGFNEVERDDEHYSPISLESHVQLLAYALRRIQRQYPHKRITLVGFSFGADMILFLSQFVGSVFADLNINKVILLDPNVNQSTTTISAKIAVVDQDRPLAQLVRILESASNVAEFRNLSEYLYKITSKNFGQIQQHAQEVVKEWSLDSFDNFLDHLGLLISSTQGVHVVLSFTYEKLFNGLAKGAVSRGLDASNLECSTCDHFELIGVGYLKDRLEGLL